MRDGERRAYEWKRFTSGWGKSDYECRDLQTGELIASFCSNGAFKMKDLGMFRVHPAINDQFREIMLVAYMAIRQIAQRTAAVTAAALS